MQKNRSEMSDQKSDTFLMVPYILWVILFVLAPLLLLIYQSLLNVDGAFTFENIVTYFTSTTYLNMTLQSFLYAGFIVFIILVIGFRAAYILTSTANK